jgi:hypothetical protein
MGKFGKQGIKKLGRYAPSKRYTRHSEILQMLKKPIDK